MAENDAEQNQETQENQNSESKKGNEKDKLSKLSPFNQPKLMIGVSNTLAPRHHLPRGHFQTGVDSSRFRWPMLCTNL